VLDSCTAPLCGLGPARAGRAVCAHAGPRILVHPFAEGAVFRQLWACADAGRPGGRGGGQHRSVLTCWAALSLIPILLRAIVLVHFPMAFFFSNPHGGWQFPARVDQALRREGAFAPPVG
jgi:hypothetical protein